jgi:hypothetical protein
MKSRGLGDTIDKITTKTGVKKAVKTIANAMGIEDCGCDGRKEALNSPKLIINKTFYKI